jgi:hypothetical protein
MTGCEGILGVVGGHRSSDLSSVMPMLENFSRVQQVVMKMITVSSFECGVLVGMSFFLCLTIAPTS